MPCYCDVPSEDDQREIENRCKIRMFFDAQTLLTNEQINECQKMKLHRFPMNPNEDLCKLCKILTEEQMKKIDACYFQIKWNHETLYDWYLKHMKDDKDNKDDKETYPY